MTYQNPFAGLLNEPVWRKCEICERETNGVRCWDCEQAMLRAADLALSSRESLRTIPERYRWAERRHTLMAERVQLPNVDREVGRILAAEQAVITLVGQAGAGKSCLAAALMRASGDALRNASWMDAYELAEAPMLSELGERAPMVRRAILSDLLVIDELRDPVQPGKRAALTDVILRRHERTTARTIVTTGMTSQQIGDAFGEGVKRRLAASDCAYVVTLGRKVQAA